MAPRLHRSGSMRVAWFVLMGFIVVWAPRLPGQQTGFAVDGWAAIAPDYPFAAVRDLARSPQGAYVAANVASSTNPARPFFSAATDAYIARINSDDDLEWSMTIGGDGLDVVHAVFADALGNVYLAGSTGSADFPLASSREPGVTTDSRLGNSRGAFLWKFDTVAETVVYSTVFGGTVPEGGSIIVESEALDVTVDADGAAYVTGWTSSPWFPRSDDALDREWLGRSGFGPARIGFVAKFASDGELLYSTYLGGDRRICGGGSNCIPVVASTTGMHVALGPAGSLFVSGTTNTTDFPVTGDAFQTECRCNRSIGDVFVARFAPDLRTLDYATYLGGNPYGDSIFPNGAESVTALAVDGAGSAYVSGWTTAPDFPTTAGSFQPEFHRETPERFFSPAGLDGFLTKLRPDGQALEFSTFFGGEGSDQVDDFALQPDGGVILTGFAASDELIATDGFLDRGRGFVAELSPNGSALDFMTRIAVGSDGPGGRDRFGPIPPGGSPALSLLLHEETLTVGERGLAIRLERSPPSQSRVWALAGSADAELPRYISPGELISLFGVAIGPDEPVLFELDADGRAPLELAGIRVTVDGVPAPILFGQKDQLNVIAPFGLVSRGRAMVQVFHGGQALDPVATLTRPATPAVFRVGIGWAILNADGTLNTFDQLASPGSIIALWMTGAGALAPSQADGSVAEPPFSALAGRLRVILLNGAGEAEVVYAGAAPGLVHGVVQINVRLPNGTNGGVTIVVEIDGFQSAPVFVYAN